MTNAAPDFAADPTRWQTAGSILSPPAAACGRQGPTAKEAGAIVSAPAAHHREAATQGPASRAATEIDDVPGDPAGYRRWTGEPDDRRRSEYHGAAAEDGVATQSGPGSSRGDQTEESVANAPTAA
jgi:hypothetical protein